MLAHLIAVQADVELQDAGGGPHKWPYPRILHHHMPTSIGESPRTARGKRVANLACWKITVSALCVLECVDTPGSRRPAR